MAQQNVEFPKLAGDSFASKPGESWADDDDVDVDKLMSALSHSKQPPQVEHLRSADVHDGQHHFQHDSFNRYSRRRSSSDYYNTSSDSRYGSNANHFDRNRDNHYHYDYPSHNAQRGNYPNNAPHTFDTKTPVHILQRTTEDSISSTTGNNHITKPRSNPFGNAKPVDQVKIEERIFSNQEEVPAHSSAVPLTPKPASPEQPHPIKPKLNPFGNAKPVDQSKIEQEIKQKLEKLSVNSTTYKLGGLEEDNPPPQPISSSDRTITETYGQKKVELKKPKEVRGKAKSARKKKSESNSPEEKDGENSPKASISILKRSSSSNSPPDAHKGAVRTKKTSANAKHSQPIGEGSSSNAVAEKSIDKKAATASPEVDPGKRVASVPVEAAVDGADLKPTNELPSKEADSEEGSSNSKKGNNHRNYRRNSHPKRHFQGRGKSHVYPNTTYTRKPSTDE